MSLTILVKVTINPENSCRGVSDPRGEYPDWVCRVRVGPAELVRSSALPVSAVSVEHWR